MTEIYISCPRCNSTEVFSWVKTRTQHCNRCSYEWEELRIHPTKDVCDFCSSPDITKDYACQSFEAFHVGQVRANSSGYWAACAACAELIEADQWEALAQRGLSTLPNVPKAGFERDLLLNFVRNLHKEFRERRLRVN